MSIGRDWKAKNPDVYTGRMLERDAFGDPKPGKLFEQYLRQLADTRGYVTRRQAMDLVRSFTEQDPNNPEKPFAKDLRIEVCSALRLPVPAWDSVRFYSSVDTPLDTFHKTDGWLEYVDPRSDEKVVVTLDVTQRKNKGDEWMESVMDESLAYRGADELIVNPAVNHNDAHFEEQVEWYAKRVADKLKQRMTERGLRMPIPFPLQRRLSPKTEIRPSK